VFASFFETHVAEAWRFTHGRDIVPSVPPALMGFWHTSREVWLVDVDARGRRVGATDGGSRVSGSSGQEAGGGSSSRLEGDSAPGGDVRPPEERMIVCDESGEDPSCHNSACRLGLCTSVADHLVYLGAHMWAGAEC
jgi:hypothetical protein